MHHNTRRRLAICTGAALAVAGSVLTTTAYGRPGREQLYLAGLASLLGSCSALHASLALAARGEQEQLTQIGSSLLLTMSADDELERRRRQRDVG